MTHRRLNLTGLRPATRAVHGGERLDIGNAIPTANPLHMSTSYAYRSATELDQVFDDPSQGYVYSRFGNPTIRAFETAMAAVEDTEAAIAYPSGMAAIHGVFTLLAKPGDHVVASRDVYGATLGLLSGHFAGIGVKTTFVDITDLQAVTAVVQNVKPTVVFAETISNPLLKMADIASLVKIASETGARLVIDNTFASPALARPTALGADLTLHSTTKFIAGHGDVTGGIVAGSHELVNELRLISRLNGAVPGPFDTWLASRGLKTLQLRMREHSANARAVADWLARDDRIECVYYPGLHEDPLASQFLSADRGAMISFEVKGFGEAQVLRYLDALELFQPAPTLGDVYSLSLYPARTSHRGLTPEQREEFGIKDNLIRLSIGIEDVEDIIADLDQALSKAFE
jgi:cystathionine beta-lyase/cystathionine gamma-synthase